MPGLVKFQSARDRDRMYGSKQGQPIREIDMQWLIDLLASHNAQLIIAAILGAVMTFLLLRFFPHLSIEAVIPPTRDSSSDVTSARRVAARTALVYYERFRSDLADIPEEFWQTVWDAEFRHLMEIAPTEPDGHQSGKLKCIVKAFVVNRFRHTPAVLGELCVNDAAFTDLVRFVDRVRGFKAGKQS